MTSTRFLCRRIAVLPILMACLFAGVSGCGKQEPSAAPGKDAKNVITLTKANFEAEVLKSSQPVLVDFWASWCGPCRQSFPWMNAMQAKYGARGLQIVAVNVDAKRADADKFLEQVPASFSIAFDSQGDTPRRFAKPRWPALSAKR